jgi:hypothetical protein
MRFPNDLEARVGSKSRDVCTWSTEALDQPVYLTFWPGHEPRRAYISVQGAARMSAHRAVNSGRNHRRSTCKPRILPALTKLFLRLTLLRSIR